MRTGSVEIFPLWKRSGWWYPAVSWGSRRCRRLGSCWMISTPLQNRSSPQLISPRPPPCSLYCRLTCRVKSSCPPVRWREVEQMAARVAARQSQRWIKWERRQKMSLRWWEMRRDDFYQTPKTFSSFLCPPLVPFSMEPCSSFVEQLRSSQHLIVWSWKQPI